MSKRVRTCTVWLSVIWPLAYILFYGFALPCLKCNKLPLLYLEHNDSLPKILNSLKLHFKKFRHTNAVGGRVILIISIQRGKAHTYLLTYLLTPWCRVLLEKLTGLQLIKRFPAFHGTRKFITALTSVRHLFLS